MAESKENENIIAGINFKLTKKEVDETKQLYGKQCKGLSHKEEQKDLWKTLAIARKNKLPLLPWVIDSFTRDRLAYYQEKKKSLQLQQWSINYPTLRSLSKEKKYQEMIQAAAQTFFHRYSAMIQLPTTEQIDDSLESFINYISEATSFINTIIEGDLISPPFQVDMMIIPKKVVDTSDEDDGEEDGDNDFETDEDEESESDEEDENKGNDEYDPYGEIKDIKGKLEGQKVIYEYRELKEGFRPRVFHEIFKDFRHKYKENNKNNDKNNSRMKPKNGKEVNSFDVPHKNRICIVVDRRKGGDKQNEIYVYIPNICGDLPDANLPEWYFQSSFSCVIPGKQQTDTITAKSPCHGYVFCVSFQIEEKDSVKSYLYTRSQMTRFLPNDISTLLPELFIMKEGSANAQFLKKEKESGAKQRSIHLKDTKFEAFRKQIRSKRK